MEFVDRKKEQQRLLQLLSSETPRFVIVRGRRRIGKSAFIGKVLRESDIYYEADRTAAPNQMRMFSRVIDRRHPGFADAVYEDWKALLKAINHRVTEPMTVCLDEFPYLVENTPALPSIVQALLDDAADPLRYHLILCGSSQQMMYNLSHDESSPLFGRDDSDFNMRPISAPFLSEALHLNAQETVENYALWGGVPRYWKLRKDCSSLKEAIDTHIFSNLGTLYEEPLHLFRDDIKDPVKTATIMSIVGNGIHRLSEIASRCNEPATNLSRPLAKLLDLGYLEKDIPFGDSPKSGKKSLYQIADPFLSFYYRFVPANRSFIEMDRRLPLEEALERELPSHFGYWWEHLCRDAVSGNKVDGVVFGKASRWWGRLLLEDEEKPCDVELDVVAESTDGQTILIGECKWSTGENGRLLTRRLEKIARSFPFARGKKVIIKLFTKTLPEEDQGNSLLPDDVLKLL